MQKIYFQYVDLGTRVVLVRTLPTSFSIKHSYNGVWHNYGTTYMDCIFEYVCLVFILVCIVYSYVYSGLYINCIVMVVL